MKRILTYFVVLVSLTGCSYQDEWDSDQVGNFEALWTVMDEHYSFFDYKQVDWNEVHQRYRAMVSNDMTDRELFDVCGDMLKELRDGHTNLIASHDVSRYWVWEQWPVNYDERIIDQHYLNFDYKMASGIKYQILKDNIGYMRYASFSSTIGEGNLDLILSYLSTDSQAFSAAREPLPAGGEVRIQRFLDKFKTTGYCFPISHKPLTMRNAVSYSSCKITTNFHNEQILCQKFFMLALLAV